MNRAIREPGPDHPIEITAHANGVRVTLGGRIIADSTDALGLKEAAYPEVWYIPRKDVDMSQLQRSTHTTYCPYKGDASYFSIPAGGSRSIDAVWTYEAPYPAVTAIRDYLAFYPDRVDTLEEYTSS